MPITGIDTEPGLDHLSAAYRPIGFIVQASATNGDPTPPVVYCDIYFNGIFYKTIKKSAAFSLGSTDSSWIFDIQDAAQEYLEKYLGTLYGSAIEAAPPLIAQAYCKFRSSGYDTEGFILPEGTAPIQGTGGTNPTAGSGEQSDTFYIVNSALQHDQAQDLGTHLASIISRWDEGSWVNGTYPLTHRPLKYYVCEGDSDFLPILTNDTPTSISIEVHYKDGTTDGDESDPICVPVGLPSFDLPDAIVGDPYEVVIPLAGSAPFDILGSVLPSWMSANIVDSTLVLSGTPDANGTNLQVSVSVENCGGDATANFTQQINATTCTPVSFGAVTFADAVAGVPYSKTVPILGSPPFVLDGFDLPGWMTVNLIGSNLQFTGTPTDDDVGGPNAIEVVVLNCGNTQNATLTSAINVLESQNFWLDASWNFKINSVTGSNVPAIGPTAVNGRKTGHQTGMSGSYTISVTGTTVTITSIIVYVDGEFYDCVLISSTVGQTFTDQEYVIAVTATEAQQVKFSIASASC